MFDLSKNIKIRYYMGKCTPKGDSEEKCCGVTFSSEATNFIFTNILATFFAVVPIIKR